MLVQSEESVARGHLDRCGRLVDCLLQFKGAIGCDRAIRHDRHLGLLLSQVAVLVDCTVVGIVFLFHEWIVLCIIEGLLDVAIVAAVVVQYVAVDELLLTELDAGLRGLVMCTLDGGDSCEGPASAAVALPLDGLHGISDVPPVDGYRQFIVIAKVADDWSIIQLLVGLLAKD